MRTVRHIVLAVVLALAVVQPAAPAFSAVIDEGGPRHGQRPGTSATQLTVRVESKAAMKRLEAEVKRTGGTILDRTADGEAVLVEAPATQGSAEYAGAIAADVPVQFAEPVGIVTALAIPTDPYYPYQWGLPKVGAPAAWDRTWGSASAVIAIVDSGVDLDHPELIGRIQPGGWDFVSNDPDPTDESGHGTGVAGIAVAQRSNGTNGAGMAPDCTILPLRVLGTDGTGSTFDVAQAIDFAVAAGVDVINLSLGGPDPDSNLELAIGRALDADVVVVAASGNENAATLYYPAAYPGVLAVGATTNTDARWADSETVGSNYGANLDMVAPGAAIYSIRRDTSDGGYWTGTSMAAPFVAGTIGLMRAVNPNATQERIISVLTSTARDVGAAGYDTFTGWGRLQADAAVSEIDVPVTSITPAYSANWYTSVPTITLTQSQPGTTYYQWDSGAESVYSAPLTNAPQGIHTLTYRSVDTAGDAEAPKTQVFRVDSVRPSTPTGVTATALGARSIRVDWAASTDAASGVVKYLIHKDGALLAETTALTYQANGLTPETAYSFTVKAVDLAGNESLMSAADVATTWTASTVTTLEANPTSPNGDGGWYRYGVTEAEAPTISLAASWPGSVTYYSWDGEPEQVYPGAPIDMLPGEHTLTYWSIADGIEETPHETRVFKYDNSRPQSPTGLYASVLSSTAVRLTWTAAADTHSGVAQYNVYRVTGTGDVFVNSTAGPATSIDIGGLTAATAYQFSVKAQDVAGWEGTTGATVAATTAAGAPAVLTPVYRFYNAGSGTHFYTPSADERDMVMWRWPTIFTFEGVAYSVNPANNSQPLYRFYNNRSASHFYTASLDEANTVIATWPHIFTYEGETYSVTPYAEPGKDAVFRFYNVRNGSHFFTASVEERDTVIARWSSTYRYEGPVFWLGK